MSDIKLIWGKYGGYEGWMHPGTVRLSVKYEEPAIRKMLGVVTSTEGGCADSFNGYDSCCYSISYIQLAGTLDLAGALLARIRDHLPDAFYPLQTWLASYGVTLEDTGKLSKGGLYLSGKDMAQALYGCNGKVGSWTGVTKLRAKEFAETVIGLLRAEGAPALAQEFTISRMLKWVVPEVIQLLYADGLEFSGWKGALQAGFFSFSANMPRVAGDHFMAHVRERGGKAKLDDPDFVIGALQRMTFGPGYTIYGPRYSTIRPVIERLYQVDLPDTSDLLKRWMAKGGATWTPPKHSNSDLQKMLIKLGYDLGPAGADGILGKKTAAATKEFQMVKGIKPADGVLTPTTIEALVQAVCEQAP